VAAVGLGTGVTVDGAETGAGEVGEAEAVGTGAGALGLVTGEADPPVGLGTAAGSRLPVGLGTAAGSRLPVGLGTGAGSRLPVGLGTGAGSRLPVGLGTGEQDGEGSVTCRPADCRCWPASP
jgi:hypothetical protein